MTALADLLKDSAYKLSQFKPAQIAALEAAITLKESGKKSVPYVICLVRGKPIKLTPEEAVRQLYVMVLRDDLGYPAISEADLLALPIPKIPATTQQAIEKSALAAWQARQRAAQLLDAAKRAVEIAIEDSAAAALAYLAGLAGAGASCDDGGHVTEPNPADQPKTPAMARPASRRRQPARRLSGQGAGLHTELDGAGKRAGGSGASAGPSGSTQPLDATRGLATAAGPKPYGEVAETLAENVGRCLEEILDTDPSTNWPYPLHVAVDSGMMRAPKDR